MQTTHFYRRKEYFYLLFPINATLTRNYKTDGIRSLKYTKRNGDNAILRIFSFIPQWQRIQPNFIYHTYQTTKQTNTTRTTNTTTPTRVSYSNFAISLPVSYNSSIANLYTSSIPKNLYVAWWTVWYISSVPTWIRYPSLFLAFPPWFSAFPLHSPYSPPLCPDSPHSHPHSSHSHPNFPHSHTYFLNFHPHSRHSSHSIPRFSFPAFTDSLLRSLNWKLLRNC